MRKLISSLSLGAVVAVMGAGCLKDKGFDAKDYGIDITEKKAVAFPLSAASPNVVGVNASATPITFDGPSITLEQSGSAAADVHVTIALKPTLVTDGGYTPLPAGAVTVSTMTPTIVAGTKFVTLKFTFPNSAALDPNLQYGLGLTISAVDQGYTIANNQRDILYVFTVKNKYDGNYSMRIKTVGWAAYGISDNLPGTWPSIAGGYSIGLVTGGPNSVRVYDYWGFDDFIQNAFTTNNASGTGFGATAPRFHFNLATDQLINVTNDLPDDGRGRVFAMNPAVTDSRYDPATKKIYAAYILKQNGRPDLMIYDTLTYKSPRP
jgi:hypothetical protein